MNVRHWLLVLPAVYLVVIALNRLGRACIVTHSIPETPFMSPQYAVWLPSFYVAAPKTRDAGDIPWAAWWSHFYLLKNVLVSILLYRSLEFKI